MDNVRSVFRTPGSRPESADNLEFRDHNDSFPEQNRVDGILSEEMSARSTATVLVQNAGPRCPGPICPRNFRWVAPWPVIGMQTECRVQVNRPYKLLFGEPAGLPVPGSPSGVDHGHVVRGRYCPQFSSIRFRQVKTSCFSRRAQFRYTPTIPRNGVPFCSALEINAHVWAESKGAGLCRS